MNRRRKTPIEIAAEIYRRDGRNFLEVVQEHIENGIVIDQPECFALAKAVVLADGRMAWMFNVTAGNLQTLSKHIPCPLPFVAMFRKPDAQHPQRDGKRLRVYPFMRFLTKSRNLNFQVEATA